MRADTFFMSILHSNINLILLYWVVNSTLPNLNMVNYMN